MARQRRGLIAEVIYNFVESLKPRSMKKRLIGKDYLGNQYYETMPLGSSARVNRPSRFYVPKDGDTSKFDEGVPPEWEAWLRLRRKSPPTEEEIQKNLAMAKQKKENALKIEQKFKKHDVEPKQEKIESFPKYDEYEIHPGEKMK
ncbi:NADH dehydrogenase [ubiquinone] 1 alpha subcomplex assembly factor 2 [Cimex lectularius]|uniref:NADH dehydrogenase [ubiquinone] 1 alpha subcomplex assembly factor 2 n=1 Tax=Cimex lectularius TaxID=79782 RepID=A0A8I6RZ02_CIMLE|nr:NADH dehydrogenase [ubiquinone] 1 alpha subcomplex assembly factor 2 [Cimex lectularius]